MFFNLSFAFMCYLISLKVNCIFVYYMVLRIKMLVSYFPQIYTFENKIN